MKDKLAVNRKKSNLQAATEELCQQMTKVKSSIDEEKRIAVVSGERYGKRMSYTIRESELGSIHTASEYESLPRKSDYKEEVICLYREGYKQQEIATMLGISQSLVSNLLRK